MSKSGRKVTQKLRNFGSVSKNISRRILWHNRIFQKKEMKFPYFPHKSSIQCTYLRLDVNLRDCTLSLSQIYSLYPRKKFSSGKSDKILARWQRFSPTKSFSQPNFAQYVISHFYESFEWIWPTGRNSPTSFSL